MKKYLNQTTVNVVAIATAVVWGACLIGNVFDKGPDKDMNLEALREIRRAHGTLVEG